MLYNKMLSKILISLIFFPILIIIKLTKHKSRLSECYNYIIIKPDNLGDVVLFLKCLNKYNLNSYNILIFVRKEFVEIVAKLQPEITVMALPSLVKLTSVFSFFATYRYFSKYWAENLIIPVRSRYFFTTDFISLMISSKRSLSLNHDGLNTKYNFSKNIEKIVYDEIITTKYESEKCCMIYFLSYTLNLPRKKDIVFNPKFEKIKHKFLILSPFTTDPKRNLTERMILSILKKTKDLNIKIIIIGSPSDKIYFRHVYLNFSNVEWRVGDTDLSDLPKLVKCSVGLICAETGTVQLGDFYDKPLMVVAGGGHYGRFVGKNADIQTNRLVCVSDDKSCFGCDWNCTRFDIETSKETYPCLSSIDIENNLKIFLKKVNYEYA